MPSLAAAGALGLGGALLGANAWVWAASRGRVHGLEHAPSAPVAVVLGAGLEPDGTPSPYLAARLLVAQQLLEDGRCSRLVVSGGRSPGHDEPAAMRDWLVGRGVPAGRITLDAGGHDTWATVRRAAGHERVLLVSQGYHLPRAVALARAAGIDAEGVGDWSARELNPLEWTRGWWRERAAALKAAWDVVPGR